jgi:membrane protein YdbS with pleckstrin-like domain
VKGARSGGLTKPELAESMVELAGRLAGEREREDPPRIEEVVDRAVGDTARQNARLAGARSCTDDEHLSVAGDRSSLFIVQAREDLGGGSIVHVTTLPTGCDVHCERKVGLTSPVMGFSTDLLSDDEEVVVDMHPHWWTMVPISALLAVVIIGGLALLLAAGDGTVWTIGRIAVGLIVLATLAVFAQKYARWVTTEFVVTTERVISRKGIVAKNGIEIPLDRINTVFFEQTAFERMAGSGDLGIESAGEGGRQTFTNIRKPNMVQAEIYAQKERFEDRRLDRIGRASAGASEAASIPDQIGKLDELRKKGVITEDEFETKKAELLKRM